MAVRNSSLGVAEGSESVTPTFAGTSTVSQAHGMMHYLFQSNFARRTVLFHCDLLQNPPCIPTLAICWLVCVVQNTKLIVDWHNYGYTILGLTLGESHMLVRFSKWFVLSCVANPKKLYFIVVRSREKY